MNTSTNYWPTIHALRRLQQRFDVPVSHYEMQSLFNASLPLVQKSTKKYIKYFINEEHQIVFVTSERNQVIITVYPYKEQEHESKSN